MNEAPPFFDYIALPRAMRLPPMVGRLADVLREEGVEGYLVGGAVRDALMGRDAEDIDIAVGADAECVARAIADALEAGYARLHDDWQAARVVLRDADGMRYVDITTIRGGIEGDLRRRDFTINAMALPIGTAAHGDLEGRLLDPCGGLRDLRDGVVRMASVEALDEDSLRLMRGVRLAAQFRFSLEAETAEAIGQRASCVAGVAPERVRDELMRLLRTQNACGGVRMLDDLGLLCAIMPELADAKGVTQPKEHYWDVFGHLVEAVGWVDAMFEGDGASDGEFPLDLVPRFDGMGERFGEDVSDGFDRLTFLKLTALLHDVAKPATKTIEDSGRIRFFGHHMEGADIGREMLTRLRFGKRGVEHVAKMVRYHLRPTQMSQNVKMPTGRALYRYYRDVGDVAVDTLFLNLADYLAARGPMLEREDWARHCGLIRHILEAGRSDGGRRREKSVKSLPKLVSGYDIIDRFALAPGPEIGRLLEAVREAQASGEVSTREQALELVSASLERGGNGA